jgi:A/G-specific adenine glycosylase
VITEKIIAAIRCKLLAWYKENARDLPWRRTRDPYAIWVSEIMLQQTRVDTVIPYYLRWLEEFPTLQTLSEAKEDQVLKIWEGLGYYRRALNLLAAARIVAENNPNTLPENLTALKDLPGIGPYTAGAILSIAFDKPAPILDGNLRRVFTRLFNINSPIQTTATEKYLWEISETLLPESSPGDFNQAMMELGALVCTPKNPRCSACPLAVECLANQLGIQEDLPVRKEKKSLPHLQVTAAVIPREGNVLLAKRPPGGLLGGLWEFPGGKQEKGETLQETLTREIMEELNLEVEIGPRLGEYQHAYTHYKVTLYAFHCRMISEDLRLNYHSDYGWIPLDELENYPMGKMDRQIAKQLRAE